MVTILMASFNGEKYIGQQIESILGQTETDWKLLIQDDCSQDSTFEIAECFAEKHSGKIEAVRRRENSGSAAANFFSMLPRADGDYVMFSDDDDAWLPDKIRITLSAMHGLEKKHGAGMPLLVHTDLCVVDEKLHETSGSMFRLQKLDSRRCGLNHLLAQNIVTGCTVMMNRALAEPAIAAGTPQHAVMHDWWLALIAASFGAIGFVAQPTILYRQHGGNSVGAKDAGSFRYHVKRLSQPDEVSRSLDATYAQAEEFLEKFSPTLSNKSSAIINDYIMIPHLSKLQKIHMLNVHDFWKTGFARKCGQLLLI